MAHSVVTGLKVFASSGLMALVSACAPPTRQELEKVWIGPIPACEVYDCTADDDDSASTKQEKVPHLP